MWEQYYSVSSVDEALPLLAQHREKARVVAGGTDIILELEKGLRPDVRALIDITRVPGLDQITFEDGYFSLGPLVTHNHVVGDPQLVEKALPLAQACWEVGAPQIRNRATVAGNIITASPANDTISALFALNAEVVLSSVNDVRIIPIQEFYTGLRKTVMRPDELLTAIRFPAMKSNQHGVFLKLGLRRAQAISIVNTAVLVEMHEQRVVSARIVLGSVAPTVITVPPAENALIGQELSDELIADTARIASQFPKPIDDVRGKAEYRSEMVKILVARALRMIANGNATGAFPENPAMLWGEKHAIVESGLAQSIAHTDHEPIETVINGESRTISTGHHKTLLRWLREDAGLIGTKEGCAEGECGACTVFLDDVAVMACMVPAPRAHGASITTIEGLRENGELHPIQSAFVDEGAVQCGYCTPGFLMSGAKLLEENPQPSLEQIQQSISGNLCRCTGYYKIVNAFVAASKAKVTE